MNPDTGKDQDKGTMPRKSKDGQGKGSSPVQVEQNIKGNHNKSVVGNTFHGNATFNMQCNDAAGTSKPRNHHDNEGLLSHESLMKRGEEFRNNLALMDAGYDVDVEELGDQALFWPLPTPREFARNKNRRDQ